MQYSVVNYKTVKEESNSLRIDADFFRPDYLEILDRIKKINHQALKNEERKVFSGPFGSFLKSESYRESGHPFVRISDIKDVYIEKEGMVYLDDQEFERVKKYHLDINDIVFSKIGTVGRLSLITDDLGKIAISENNIGIKFQKNIDIKNRFYIFTFLLSKYGQKQIFRLSSGNIQPKLNVSDIENLILPTVSVGFTNTIYRLVVLSQQKFQSSKSFYSQAEQILLSELGLLDWKPKHKLAFIKKYSDTQNSDRFDAEYFQPKYEEIIEAVKKYKILNLGNKENFKIITGVYSKSYSELGTNYIRSVNIQDDLSIDENEMYKTDEKFEDKFKIRTGDIVTSRVGSIGTLGIISEKLDGGFISDNILRIRNLNKELNNLYLGFYLKKIGSFFMDRLSRGSVQQRLNQETLKEINIPLINLNKQLQISNKIKTVHASKSLSKSLLEIAKRGVEMAIEKNETEAEKWINEEIKLTNIVGGL
jgi:restriction endonuclease S subunit